MSPQKEKRFKSNASRKSRIELEKEFADATIDYLVRQMANRELRKKMTEATRRINEATMKIVELKETELQRLRNCASNCDCKDPKWYMFDKCWTHIFDMIFFITWTQLTIEHFITICIRPFISFCYASRIQITLLKTWTWNGELCLFIYDYIV